MQPPVKDLHRKDYNHQIKKCINIIQSFLHHGTINKVYQPCKHIGCIDHRKAPSNTASSTVKRNHTQRDFSGFELIFAFSDPLDGTSGREVLLQLDV